MEAQLEKEARLLQLQANSRYSQDSAIGTDLQDWDTEILNIELVIIIQNKPISIYVIYLYYIYFY